MQTSGSIRSFSTDLLQPVMSHLGVNPDKPTLALLEQLIDAYPRTVPWESASRIARRAAITETRDCPRWPDVFWTEAIEQGLGGTCFESNGAFFALLTSLGYEGCLTINNMGDTIGCHTAIILNLDGGRWLVDMGLPVYAPLRIDPAKATSAASPFHRYTVRPSRSQQFEIERTHHRQTNCFTLIDEPVADGVYCVATADDYAADGLFLDRVIINKIVDGRQWRFNSSERPWRLETFESGERTEHPLSDHAPQIIADHFGMGESIVHDALDLVERH